MKTAQVIELLKGKLSIEDIEGICKQAAICVSSATQNKGDYVYDFEDGSLCRFINMSACNIGRVMQVQDKRV